MAATNPTSDPQGGDRRAMPRAKTHRPAAFNASSGDGFLRGTVVDLSPNGLCIHTHQPLPAGTPIEIEVAPRNENPEETTLLVRGEVLRVENVDGSLSAMGIQLRVKLPVSGGVTSLGNRGQAEALLQQLAADLKASPATGGQAAEWNALAERETNAVRFREAPQSPRRPWLLALLVMVLLLLGAIAAWFANNVVSDVREVDGQGSSDTWRFQRGGDSAPRLQDKVSTGVIASLHASLESTTPPLIGLEASTQLLDAGQTDDALEAFRVLSERRDNAPVEQLRAELGIAQALADTGRTDEALAGLSEFERVLPTVPDPWREAVTDWHTALDTGNHDSFRMEQRMDLSSAMDALAAETPETLRIEVSTTDYLLTVYENDRSIAAYPVGLGFNDATPVGTFTIANMIENPDWYNRGDVIKAGDPSNPLGEFWMGLGVGGEATPYGIHPTAEPESIGANRSRGCIRMRPDDAAELFAWCEVGTPVTVGP